MSKWFILVGVFCLFIGIALKYAPWLLNWFGQLPGDINVETERGKVFIPITSMVVVSVLLSILLSILRK